MEELDFILSLSIILIIFVVTALLISIVAYVIQSLALHTAAASDNIKNPWLAWIPIGNQYIMFKLANINTKILFLYIPYVISYIINMILSLMSEVSYSGCIVAFSIISGLTFFILSLVMTIFIYISHFKIAKKFNINIVWPILMIFIPFIAIFYFIILYKKAKSTNINKIY